MSITNFTETHNEKFQYKDTMSSSQIAYIFGRSPLTWIVSGTLLNDVYAKWYPTFREYWHGELRGSVLAARQRYAVFSIPAAYIYMICYPVGLNMLNTAGSDALVSFSMAFFVKGFQTIPNISTRNIVLGSDSPQRTAVEMAINTTSLDGGVVDVG
jgi:hypothetical protein